MGVPARSVRRGGGGGGGGQGGEDGQVVAGGLVAVGVEGE